MNDKGKVGVLIVDDQEMVRGICRQVVESLGFQAFQAESAPRALEIIEQQPDGTKTVKQKVARVQIPEMAAIIRNIARDGITWREEPLFGTQVPTAVDGVDFNRFTLAHFYSREQIEALAQQLFRERVEFLQQFHGLNPAIVAAITNHPPRRT